MTDLVRDLAERVQALEVEVEALKAKVSPHRSRIYRPSRLPNYPR